jgi:hypothetical protein
MRPLGEGGERSERSKLYACGILIAKYFGAALTAEKLDFYHRALQIFIF